MPKLASQLEWPRGREIFFALLIGAAMALAACSPGAPEAADEAPSEAVATVSESVEEVTQMFIPDSFEPPVLVEGPGFKLVPLGPELVKIDFDAYMSSIEHLQETFTRSDSWPTTSITDADAMLDMETEQRRFQERESFAYAVLTPDGTRERGCVYVRPPGKPGFDATVRLWVTKAEFDGGFDEELYNWTQGWVKDNWPFSKVAYPGRELPWETWDLLPELGTEDPTLVDTNLATAERFIDAFYSFERERLAPLLSDAPSASMPLLYYQGWAEGGNYLVVDRQPCAVDPSSPALIHCPITVQDDPVVALKTGFNVTDTFTMTFAGTKLVHVDTSSNDQPIYYQAREWVLENMPEIMDGPCKGFYAGGTTPGACARAMTEGYRRFAASDDFPGTGE